MAPVFFPELDIACLVMTQIAAAEWRSWRYPACELPERCGRNGVIELDRAGSWRARIHKPGTLSSQSPRGPQQTTSAKIAMLASLSLPVC